MTKRKVVAMATVATLPLFVGSTHSAGAHTTELAPHSMERSVVPSPQWAYVLGMEGVHAEIFTELATLACESAGRFIFICRVQAAV